MTKNIETLVEDIYGLFEQDGDVDVSDEAIEQFAGRVAQVMKERLREKRDSSTPKLRLSQIGKHDRKLWYDMHSEHVEHIDGQTRVKFLYGDLVEELILFLAQCSGHTVTDQQLELEVEGVKGHQDCRIDGIVTDVKTASFFGFKKFVDRSIFNGNDPFGYQAQISAYAQAQGEREAAFLVINKDNAEILLVQADSIDMINAEDRVNEVKRMVGQSTPPSRCYDDVPDGVSGNRVLGNDCGWCPHKHVCWADANNGMGLRSFEYQERGKTKPKYFTTVLKQPKVTEIT